MTADDYTVSSQAVIHNHEHKKEYEEAAQLLIDFKYYQISRGAGLLARMPHRLNGIEALKGATERSWSPHRDQFYQWTNRGSVERAAGVHYLQYHAPDHDKVYVTSRTMDCYRRLGGGAYPGQDAISEKRSPGPERCQICSQPSTWPNPQYCEACLYLITRLPRLLGRPAGLELILRTIGSFGLYEAAIILQGREQADDRSTEPIGSPTE